MGHTDNANNVDIDKQMYGGKLHAMSLRQFLNKGRDMGSVFTHAMASAFSLSSNLIAQKQREDERAEFRWHAFLMFGRKLYGTEESGTEPHPRPS